MRLLPKLYVSFKLFLIVSVLVGSVGFAAYSYNYMDNAFEQAQDDRESDMSDVEQEYSVSASCDGTDCQYMLMTDDDSSVLHPIEVDSKETVTFDGKEFRITATNTTVKAVTETEAGETVIVDIDKTL